MKYIKSIDEFSLNESLLTVLINSFVGVSLLRKLILYCLNYSIGNRLTGFAISSMELNDLYLQSDRNARFLISDFPDFYRIYCDSKHPANNVNNDFYFKVFKNKNEVFYDGGKTNCKFTLSKSKYTILINLIKKNLEEGVVKN